jgi:hypothetical protein
MDRSPHAGRTLSRHAIGRQIGSRRIRLDSIAPCNHGGDCGGYRKECYKQNYSIFHRPFPGESLGESGPDCTEPEPPPTRVLLPSDATPADLLAANLRKALHRQAELLDLPVDPADPRVGRLIADVANQTLNAALRAQENSLAAKRDDDEHDRAMAALIEERRQKALLQIAKMREQP